MIRYITAVLLICFVSSSQSCVFAQSYFTGLPLLRNFPKEEYQGGTQNWTLQEGARGRIFVANNNGLLRYGGQQWRLYPQPRQSIARSMVMDSSSQRIYIGGQDEVGYFAPDANGVAQYHDLKPLIAEPYRQFEDVWDALLGPQGDFFFRASDRIYRCGKDTCQVFTFREPVLFLATVKGEVLVQLQQDGLRAFDGKSFQPLPGSSSYLEGQSIVEMLPWRGDSTLIFTNRQGIHLMYGGRYKRWPNSIDYYQKQHIQCAAPLQSGGLAIGTELGGLLLLDDNGRITRQMGKREGLQTNNIHALLCDRNGNLWMGMDNGIDLLYLHAPYSQVLSNPLQEGLGYDLQYHAGALYAGTNSGLYRMPWREDVDPLQDHTDFELIPGSAGQVWGLDRIDDKLFMGHNDGAFLIEEAATPLRGGVGSWNFRPYPLDSSLMLSGHYFGVSLYEKRQDKWKFRNRLEGFAESSRFLTCDQDGDLWVSHPYRGIFRLRPDADFVRVKVKHFGREEGLPDDFSNYLFPVLGQLVAATKQGVFKYIPDQQRFQRFEELDSLIGNGQEVQRLLQDKNRIWYISTQELGYLQIEDQGLEKTIQKKVLPGLRDQLVAGFERIYPLDRDHIFFGNEEGFLHLDARRSGQSSIFSAYMEEVRVISGTDSLCYGGFRQKGGPTASFRPQDNAFRFIFSASSYSPFTTVEYQYKLKGLDEEWSVWTANNSREYTNLHPGTYQFQLRARDGQQVVEGQPYTFTIRPPWYATSLAYGVYLFSTLGALLALVLIPQRRFQREKAQLIGAQREQQARMQAQQQQSEQKINRLNQEKLQAEVNHKNAELASTTMHLLQKTELLQKLEAEITKIKEQTVDRETRKRAQRMVALLREDTRLDQDWEQFFHHFDQVHENFLKRLRERYPQLSPKDHKLCAYLRMNLTTKEIAPLMNISVRGVEISRYRLRKKLDLPKDRNLNAFMQEL